MIRAYGRAAAGSNEEQSEGPIFYHFQSFINHKAHQKAH